MNTKITTILFAFILGFSSVSKADEGMWLPLLVERLNYVDMQKMGLQLTPEEIYSVNHSSIKDAIIIFGRGCTGGVISNQGLILTNHHCGYGQIQAHSSVEHDYLTAGFWAMSKEEELPNSELSVKFLIRIENVTDVIINELNFYMTEDQRDEKIEEISNKQEEEAIKGTHYEANVKSFYEGNEFYLFVYETYKDVRLVGAPPSSIGKFGGDTDNWMWPRHTGDFSMFRIYTAPDGSPATYSKNNIPLKPKYHLPVSTAGYENGDFTMILGYPGSTDRYMPSYGVELSLNETNPSIVKIRDKKMKIMRADMDADKNVMIQYASKYASTSNYWKYFIGQSKGLISNNVHDEKQLLESQFEAWVTANTLRKKPFGKALQNMSMAYAQKEKYNLAIIYFKEAIYRGIEIIAFTKQFNSIYDELKTETPNQEKINNLSKSLVPIVDMYFKDYNKPTDKKMFAAMLKLYYDDISKNQHHDIYWYIDKKHKGDINSFTEEVFKKTIFADKEKVLEFLKNPNLKTFEKDLAYTTAQSFMKNYRKINAEYKETNDLLNRGKRDFIAGLREMNTNIKYYPDANFTMRLTYGKVMDYYPTDAIHFDFYTTLKGVMEKEDTDNSEFVVEEKLKDLYKKGDYGEYAKNGELYTCFLTNNDITGGNSGSPVINAWGELIGVAFDGNWEAMSGDIIFKPKLQRCINVDIRYILFIIDKYAGATHLINEMTVVKMKHPKPVIKKEQEITEEEEKLILLKGRG